MCLVQTTLRTSKTQSVLKYVRSLASGLLKLAVIAKGWHCKAAHFTPLVGVWVIAHKHSPAICLSSHGVRDAMCLWRNSYLQLLYTDSCHGESKAERDCARPADGKAACGFLHQWFHHCQKKGALSRYFWSNPPSRHSDQPPTTLLFFQGRSTATLCNMSKSSWILCLYRRLVALNRNPIINQDSQEEPVDHIPLFNCT